MNKTLSYKGLPAVLAGIVILLAGCAAGGSTRQELINKGNWHLWRAEHIEAIGPYTAAYEMNPADPEVLFKIGECHFFLGNYREASKWYRQAIKSFPGHREAAMRLEQAQGRLPEFSPPASSETGPDAVNLPPPRVVAQGFINNARTYESQGDLDRALNSYKKAVEAADDLAFTHAELGRFYLRTGRNAEALAQLRLAEKLDPAEPGLAEDLARLGVQ